MVFRQGAGGFFRCVQRASIFRQFTGQLLDCTRELLGFLGSFLARHNVVGVALFQIFEDCLLRADLCR